MTDQSQAQQNSKKLTPEMLRKLTDKVYKLWLRDLELDRQNRGLRPLRRRVSGRR